MKVYIAGPYSAGNVISVLDNIRKGQRASTEVFLMGHSPFCPWLDFQFQLQLREGEELTVDDYYRYSIDWMEVSDIVVFLPGWEASRGSVAELARAKECGIPVMLFDEFKKKIGSKAGEKR